MAEASTTPESAYSSVTPQLAWNRCCLDDRVFLFCKLFSIFALKSSADPMAEFDYGDD